MGTTLRGRLVDDGMAGLVRAGWDGLAPPGDPFLSSAYLSAMEASGSATSETGWQPLHLAVEDGQGGLAAAAPLYAKGHSWGEYVFDQGWADAYRRAGGRYYPKLQVAVPFTPVPGSRLLARDDDARATLAEALRQTAAQAPVSSLHVTFCTAGEAELLGRHGFLVRRGMQYHWSNQGYGDFQDFLDAMRSSKKKMVRKEREQVRTSGLEIEVLDGEALTGKALNDFYPFYLATVDKRWGSAYLTRDFFRRLGRDLKDRIVLVTARKDGDLVACALNLRGSDALYGRLWGCLEDYRFLHFECCYYRAIEYAITHGIPRVEAGAQGTHKIARGYAPVWTWSAHLLKDPGLEQAVARFLEAEGRGLEEQMGELEGMLPYRREGESG